MQPSAPNSTLADLDIAANDLGPLAWVLDELRKSLEGATKALKRFVREAEAARGSDLAALDSAQLRTARQQLHQAVGALEMVGLQGPALVLRAMEAAVQKFLQQPELCSQAAAGKMERASFALTEYLEAVLAGRPISAVSLFPQYRDVQELVRADRIHPADLWIFDWRWIEPELPVSAAPRDYGDEARTVMDRSVLPLMKGNAPQAAADLRALSLALAAAQNERQPRIFWKIAAAYFEAVAHGVLPADLYVRRASSRILLQYNSLARGDTSLSERLAQDLLFFCTQAVADHASDTPVLSAVRAAYGLARFKPVDYELVQFGRFDPALLAQARKRITSAKETWSSLSAGELGKFKSVADQFSLVTDSLLKLHPPSERLAQALTRAIDTTVRSGQQPGIELAMEVATSVLYLEAAFDDLDPADPQLVVRTANLADRLEGVRVGGAPQPLEGWMEELYRRVSDKHTMGSVVDELRISLGELEKALDAFFRNPQDKTSLQPVPGQLSQMRGVLSVLGLDQASYAVLRMRDSVEGMLTTELDEQMARGAGTFEQLGNNLGALSFLIDMLNYQPALAKKLFVYDDIKGELKPLMGRASSAANAASALTVHPVSLPAEVTSVMQAADAGQTQEELTDRLDALANQAALADQPALARSARAASAAVTADDAEATSAAMASLALSMAPTPQPAPLEEATDFEEDDLRGIFLDEAREVVASALEAVGVLQDEPGDTSQLTVLRRAFHTLKGSARMVGLHTFGDAAWAMEQLLNSWLADQKPVTDAFRAVCADVMHGFDRWVSDVAAGTDGHWTAAGFDHAADALQNEGRYSPLMPVTAPATADTPALSEGFTVIESTDGFDFDFALDDVSSDIAEVGPIAPGTVEATALASADAMPNEGTEAAESDQPRESVDPTHDARFFPEFEATTTLDNAGDFDFMLDTTPPADVPNVANVPLDDNAMAAIDAIDGIDFDSLLALSADSAATAPLQPVDAALPLSSDTELIDFSFQDMPSSVPAVEATPGVELSDIDGDFDSHFGGLPAAEASGFAALDAVDSAVAEPVELVGEPDLAMAFADGEALDFGLDDQASANVEPFALFDALAPADRDGSGDEQVRVIGDLRIGIPLYNVYLNEADEWSRRLVTEVAEWQLEVHQPVSESTIALAHSLAGSSATVGFHALSDISRALEHALMQSRSHHNSGASQYGQLFVDASEDIRRLLHQFAAGFLKQPDAGLLQKLKDLEFNDSVFPPGADLAEGYFDDDAPPRRPVSIWGGLPDDEPAAKDADATDFAGAASSADAADGLVVPAPAPATPAVRLVWAAPQTTTTALPASTFRPEQDDEIDARDVIDPDLFPIFEEEGAELMPQLGSALRQWSARPDNLSARLEVLRVLHTLKGSARLTGALRLGEMAHRIETEIDYVGSDAAATQEFEPLLTRFDAMQLAFDNLRHPHDVAPDAFTPDVEPTLPAESFAPVDEVFNTDITEAGTPEVSGRQIAIPAPQAMQMQSIRQAATASVRVRSQLLDRMVNQAGEVMITRSRLEAELGNLRGSLNDMTGNLNRLRQQLRDIELQAETQMQSRLAQAKEAQAGFDPLEFDRFTRVQELTRMMAESVNDVATVQRTLQRTVEATEDDLIAQARQTRELQRDLLRTRMVEFEGISERLYRVVRLASKETGKQVRLDLLGGTVEMDRGMLDRLTPAFEHLLRNAVAHGIESPEQRTRAGKDPVGLITVHLRHEGNDVSVDFSDDGAGLDLARIRDKAQSVGLLQPGQSMSDQDAANLIFMPGFSTAAQVTELAGRGIGMDVVRNEINAIGGRIETSTSAGQGTHFKLVLPLTTAVTQVVMIRAAGLTVGVPANVVETVRRATGKELQQAYNSGTLDVGGEAVPFFWSGALLQASHHSSEPQGKTTPVVVFRSAAQRMALHVDEVLGNQEVVVKNLGPQLSRLPGLAGMSVLASGAVVLIYNPVALASVYGEQARAWSTDRAEPHVLEAAGGTGGTGTAMAQPAAPAIPLIMVVDDSITVRRVTQRLLQREGYRVVLAADGLQALEKLQDELPTVVLSDIEMPRMDGFDLTRNIRADSRLAKLPIIMITSRIAEKHRDHARELGVDHYLGKPYSEEELMSLVKHYCAAATAATASAPA